MPFIAQGLSTLAIALLFYTWRAHHERQLLRERRLRERVAYLLLRVANTVTG